ARGAVLAGRAGIADPAARCDRWSVPERRRHSNLRHRTLVPGPGLRAHPWAQRIRGRQVALGVPRVPLSSGEDLREREMDGGCDRLPPMQHPATTTLRNVICVLAAVSLAACSWWGHKRRDPPNPTEIIVNGAPADSVVFVDGSQAGQPAVRGRPQMLD